MLELPKNLQKRREEEMKQKVKEAREKLDAFLEKEELFVGATLRYSPTGLLPEIMVMPREFIGGNQSEKR